MGREKKNKRHTESVYLNGYVGCANNLNNLNSNKSKTKKNSKDFRISINKIISNFNSNRSSLSKTKGRLNKSEMLRTKVSIKNKKINKKRKK